MGVIAKIPDQRIGNGIDDQRKQQRQSHQRGINAQHLRIENQQEIVEAIILYAISSSAKAIYQFGCEGGFGRFAQDTGSLLFCRFIVQVRRAGLGSPSHIETCPAPRLQSYVQNVQKGHKFCAERKAHQTKGVLSLSVFASHARPER